MKGTIEKTLYCSYYFNDQLQNYILLRTTVTVSYLPQNPQLRIQREENPAIYRVADTEVFQQYIIQNKWAEHEVRHSNTEVWTDQELSYTVAEILTKILH